MWPILSRADILSLVITYMTYPLENVLLLLLELLLNIFTVITASNPQSSHSLKNMYQVPTLYCVV